MCHYVAHSNGRPQILEVGPGTGPATAELVRLISAEDRLRIVELNDVFVEFLRRRFTDEHEFARAADRCEIVHDRLENLPHDVQYDMIISGLPLNNFSIELVESILECFDAFSSLVEWFLSSNILPSAKRRRRSADARTASACKELQGSLTDSARDARFAETRFGLMSLRPGSITCKRPEPPQMSRRGCTACSVRKLLRQLYLIKRQWLISRGLYYCTEFALCLCFAGLVCA